MEKQKKVQTIIIVGIVFSIFLALIGVSYSYLAGSFSGNENNSTLRVAFKDMRVRFTAGNVINATKIAPGWTQTKTFTVTNIGDVEVTYSINFTDVTNTLVNKYLLTYTLTGSGGGISIPERQMPSISKAIGNATIAPGVTHSYSMVVLYESISENQGPDMSKQFSFKITIDEEKSILLSWFDSCTVNSNLLNCSILSDNPEYTTQVVENDTMFASAATTDEGLWTENRAGKTEDNLPVYFFRGDVNNNYVSFAGKMWRIVRINEDGTVKLILGGNTPTDGYGGTTVYNPDMSTDLSVRYYYLNRGTLRIANEDWYIDENLDEYELYIAQTRYCNDISYGANNRLKNYNKTPQFKCPNPDDNWESSVVALTADEVAYAGGLYQNNNASYYLFDNAQASGNAGHWWLLTPSSYNYSSHYANIFYVGALPSYSGRLYQVTANTTLGFRPVISLKSDVVKLSGIGTFGSPYVIMQ